MAEARLNQIANRLEAVAAKLEAVGAGQSGGSAADDDNEDFPCVIDYDQRVHNSFKTMLGEGNQIDPEVTEISQYILNVSASVRQLLICSQKYQKPTTDPFAGIHAAQEAGVNFADTKIAKTKFPNHMRSMKQIMDTLSWPKIANAESYVENSIGSVQFYTNKILVEFRGKNEHHVKWVNSVVAGLKAIPEFINDHVKGGVKWSTRGKPCPPEALLPKTGGAAPKVAPAAKAAPAPAPAAKTTPAPAGKPALNIPVRAAAKSPAVTTTPKSVDVQYYDGTAPTIESVKIEQVVNIYSCKNTTIKVPGKCTAVNCLNCEKLQIVIHDIVGSLELNTVKGCQIYFDGICKTATIHKSERIELYLNEASKDCELYTSASSGVNLEYPDPKDPGNFVEFPIPEQIKTVNKGGKPVFEVFQHQ